MNYFSRRNEYVTEYSGHEEVSREFRDRLKTIFGAFIGRNNHYGDRSWFVERTTFEYYVNLEFPNQSTDQIIEGGDFHKVFTVLEIFLDLTGYLDYRRAQLALDQIGSAFNLSGSVYKIGSNNQVELRIDQDLAEKVKSIESVLNPFPEFYDRFFQATGNLLGRRAKPEDVVKDIYVASEGYLKQITDESTFTNAILKLSKESKINREQKKVLDALHEFRSNSDGAGHAGNAETPTEETALWFLDTMVSQLRMIDKANKRV